MKTKLIILLTVLGLLSAADAAIINVPGNYPTIQGAINAAQNHDTILVEPGTYFENINFRGKNIVVTSRYYLTNDPATIYATIINGSTPSNPDTGSCVIITGNVDSTAALQGFAITGGTGTKWLDEHGAGLYREGGGILIQYSSPVVQNNIIFGNLITNLQGVTSTGGGGIRIGDGYPRVYNNVVMNNTSRYGAGIVLNFTGGEYKNNVVCANYGSNQYGAGTGIWMNGSFSRPIFIINNTVVSNSSSSGIPGVYSNGASSITLINNIVWGNTSPGGFQIGGAAMTVRYCDVQGGYSGEGNINSNPAFSDSNYILLASSPCVDRGDSSAIYNYLEDPQNPGFAKWPSRGTLRNDIGAYGGPLARILSNLIIGIKEISANVPNDFVLYQNYPNPFNPVTKIKFDIPVTPHSPLNGGQSGVIVSLAIYDILGKEVAMLVNEQLKPGTYEVEWSATGGGAVYPSGIYFYKLIAGGFSVTRKMVLVK